MNYEKGYIDGKSAGKHFINLIKIAFYKAQGLDVSYEEGYIAGATE